MGMRTPLARIRGLGSAKEGVQHWWMQRMTAAALVPLVLWFVISLIGHVGAPREALVDWLSSPVVATLMIALLIAVFYHAKLGIQVVIEDYVHGAAKVVSEAVAKAVIVLLGVASVVSVLKLAFGG